MKDEEEKKLGELMDAHPFWTLVIIILIFVGIIAIIKISSPKPDWINAPDYNNTVENQW